jgi:hypothetical protein
LVVEEVGSRANLWAWKPMSPQRPWEAVFLCHALDVTLSEEQLVGPCLGSVGGHY